MEKRLKLTLLILRVGVAFVFVYAAVSAYLDPDSWIGYFPTFLQGVVSDSLLLNSWGLVEIILAVWLISTKKPYIPSVLMTVALFGLIVSNLGALPIIFRDVAIMTTTLALSIWYHPQTTDRSAEIAT